MRVLLTSTDNPYTAQLGGKHVHLRLLERGLKAVGIDVITLYYSRKNLKEFAKRSALILFSEKLRFKRKVELMMDYLRKHIPREKIDLIHAHDVLSILALNSMPQKKVLTLHGYFSRENIEFLKNPKNTESIRTSLFQLERDAMKHADYVITVDQRLKEYVLSEFNYPQNKITVMHNAVDTDCFSPIPEHEQRKLKNSLKLDAQTFIVLVPRRLVEKNGVMYAVDAMANLKNENVKMIIAGEGPERNEIAKKAQSDNRIQLIGAIPHNRIDVYFKMADIILIPSVTSHGIQEATSLSMLEGMACGKVVVCSDIGGMHEVIQNMKTGIVVPERQTKEIAVTIERVYRSPSLRACIGREARQYVLENHSFLAHAKRVADIYAEVMTEGNTGKIQSQTRC